MGMNQLRDDTLMDLMANVRLALRLGEDKLRILALVERTIQNEEEGR